jgi:hypothetical protein
MCEWCGLDVPISTEDWQPSNFVGRHLLQRHRHVVVGSTDVDVVGQDFIDAHGRRIA